MLYSTIVFKENLKAPAEYYESEYREGTEVMNFLFDVINEIAGYGSKYYSELASVTDDEGLIKKYKKYRGVDPEETEDLHSRHLHCLMAIEGVENLKEMRGAEKRPQDYFDSLLLRLMPGS